ncbi:hypothetical protein A1O3_03082 [Capronia epimyces CBS 606.96]|uniref:Uncharacterized protein n=1 Tax=Capronia epimyces CBS 606.96 TaxID=1182542 RepID=W9Z697_9EURO|nr:uncharacterized protein A1O3_03082 [Capronia epimyces CBS 606.96]EXJ90014.1 hypothetical protein A1O3_03082 [Capronia epimyces CBS 606.96]
MGLFDKLQAKIELYRLEQKYARRKNKTSYTTGAQYVDGEYIYSDQSSPTVSANSTGGSHRSKRQTVLWTPTQHRR